MEAGKIEFDDPNFRASVKERAKKYLSKFNEFDERERDYIATDMASFAISETVALRTILRELREAAEKVVNAWATVKDVVEPMEELSDAIHKAKDQA